MNTQYNADVCFRSVKVQNEMLNFNDERRLEAYHAFKTGYIKGHMKIVEIKARIISENARAVMATV